MDCLRAIQLVRKLGVAQISGFNFDYWGSPLVTLNLWGFNLQDLLLISKH